MPKVVEVSRMVPDNLIGKVPLERLYDRVVSSRFLRGCVGGLALVLAAVANAACGAAQPHPLPATAATFTAETTATVEATATATMVFVPTLGPLPDNSDLQLPFPGYKQEIFINGWNILKDSWNPLWMKWGQMAADQLGPGGSLVVRPVEGEAGIVCEDVVDGSYKGMTLCPPLDLVNGGLLPFPGTDSAPNTDYYPLLIKRSSQFARLKSIGTGIGLMLQEVDSAGNPTRYIQPKNGANGKGWVWLDGEYKVPIPPIVLPDTVTILSSEAQAAKHFDGSGFELITMFQGIPVDFTEVTSSAKLQEYNQTQGCVPNQEMLKYGVAAEDRIAEMIFLGHYVGWLRYKGWTEEQYPFEKYIEEMQQPGIDRSYTIWGAISGKNDGIFMVDPRKPLEFVITGEKADPVNGRRTARTGNETGGYGYQHLENGGVRIVSYVGYSSKNYRYFCTDASANLNAALLMFGMADINDLKNAVGIPLAYPVTKARMDAIYRDIQMWENSNHTISPTILVP